MLGEAAVLGVVEGQLELVEPGGDDDPSSQALVVDAADRRKPVRHEGHLRHYSGRADVIGPPAQRRADLGGVEEP